MCGYALDDLLQQDCILAEVVKALGKLRAATAEVPCVLVVGAPLRVDGRLFNCAVVLQGGRALGVAPKSYLPNFREFYEGPRRRRCLGARRGRLLVACRASRGDDS